MSLTRATDRAIAEENRRFLSDPAAIAEARAEGDLYRRRLEAEGILPPLFLDPDEECDPDHPEPGLCVRSCRRDGDQFLRDASWNGEDGEAPCNCEHHEVEA